MPKRKPSMPQDNDKTVQVRFSLHKTIKENQPMTPTTHAKPGFTVMILALSVAASACFGADNVGDALRLKALDGDVKAMKELGDYYLGEYYTKDGKRLAEKKNRTEALKWYRKAARKGDISAMERLVNSDQLPVEEEERSQWFEKIERNANKLSEEEKKEVYQFIALGYFAFRKDPIKAMVWMSRTCDLVSDWKDLDILPSKFACSLRGEDLRGKRDSPMQAWVNFPAHAKFLEYAIEKDLPFDGNYGGNVLLRVLMGEAYERGFGVAQDHRAAYRWYVNAVEYAKTHTCRSECVGYAQRRLGECLRYGKGCKRNLQEAVKWYEKAALNKDLEARNQFADWCLDGLVEVGDHEWTAKAAEGGHAFLSLVAGENMPAPRYVIEPDVRRAEELSETRVYAWCDPQEVIASYRLCRIYHARGEWDKMVKELQGWRKSSQDSFKNPFKAKMTYWLAVAHTLGKGVKVDHAKGEELMKEAAQLGDPEAMEILDKEGIDYDVRRDR